MATTDGGVVALLKVLDVTKFSLFCVVLALACSFFSVLDTQVGL